VPSSSSARRSATLVLAVVLLALCGGCRVDVRVGIDAAADGSGEVRASATLDKGAVTSIGDLKTKLALDDLVKAGWRIDGPKAAKDGGATITARHRYRTPADAAHLVEDLSGATGPLQQFRIRQHRSFLRTATTLTGTVDLQRGVGSFSDPKLTEALGGQPLGVTDAQLERRLGESLQRLFGMQVAVRLPGKVEANAPTVTSNGAVWAPKLGERVVLEATSKRWNVANIAFVVVAAGAALALVAVAVRHRRSTAVTVSNDGEDAPVD
jgi:hypothetical protein